MLGSTARSRSSGHDLELRGDIWQSHVHTRPERVDARRRQDDIVPRGVLPSDEGIANAVTEMTGPLVRMAANCGLFVRPGSDEAAKQYVQAFSRLLPVLEVTTASWILSGLSVPTGLVAGAVLALLMRTKRAQDRTDRLTSSVANLLEEEYLRFEHEELLRSMFYGDGDLMSSPIGPVARRGWRLSR